MSNKISATFIFCLQKKSNTFIVDSFVFYKRSIHSISLRNPLIMDIAQDLRSLIRIGQFFENISKDSKLKHKAT